MVKTKSQTIEDKVVDFIVNGDKLASNEDYKGAIQQYDKAQDLDPNNGDIACAKAFAFESMGNYKEAIACCDKAYALSADESILVIKAQCLSALGTHEDEISVYDKVIARKLSESAPIYLSKAIALRKIGKYDQALLSYDKAAELEPENILAWFGKKELLEEMGRTKEAEKYQKKLDDLTEPEAIEIARKELEDLLKDD